jgi:hypothetical protein
MAHAMLFSPFAREVWSAVKQSYDVHLNQKGFTSIKAWLAVFFGHEW